MKLLTKGLASKWEAESANLTSELERAEVPHSHIFSLEDKEDEFLEEYNWVISNETIKDVEEGTNHDVCPQRSDYDYIQDQIVK